VTLDPSLSEALERFGLVALREAPCRLSGDVGGRRYFRVRPAGGVNRLVVLYPEPGSAPQRNWTELQGELDRAGLRVPRLEEDAPDIAAALIEDLGDRDLADELAEAPHEDRARLLDEAEGMLGAVRSLAPERVQAWNPPFDAAFFARELAMTRHWALERGGEAPLTAGEAAAWDGLAGELAATAAAGAPVPTHRDFHANNLMRTPAGELAVIDFQDLRMGPRDYDPVSLRFERAGAGVGADPSAYSEAVLLQRAWKVLGTFEKMLQLGRAVYRPHRDTTLAVLRRATAGQSRYQGLLQLLERAGVSSLA